MDRIASKIRTNPVRDDVPDSLKGKVAIVTGSTSGIGAATVRELSARGATVVINYPWASEKSKAEQVGASLKPDSSPWIAVEANMATLDGPATLIKATVERFGERIDILVHNAAYAHLAPVEETTPELFDRSMHTNVRGPLLVTQAALPYLPSPKNGGGGGRIICITSEVTTHPQELQAAYGASKGALATLTRNLAKELPPKYGCTVNAVSPGIIKTPQFLDELVRTAPPFVPGIFDSMTPVDGWIGLPEDVAFAVAFLAEERAGWVNGSSINVSGGMFMS